jgi:hypothetical protein
VKVIIETLKDSRNKYAFDEEQTIFALTKVLPVGSDLSVSLIDQSRRRRSCGRARANGKVRLPWLLV